jgi:hypothetical protein
VWAAVLARLQTRARHKVLVINDACACDQPSGSLIASAFLDKVDQDFDRPILLIQKALPRSARQTATYRPTDPG